MERHFGFTPITFPRSLSTSSQIKSTNISKKFYVTFPFNSCVSSNTVFSCNETPFCSLPPTTPQNTSHHPPKASPQKTTWLLSKSTNQRSFESNSLDVCQISFFLSCVTKQPRPTKKIKLLNLFHLIFL